MKYSFMTFSCPELTLDDVLALAKQEGYSGVEPRIGSGHKHGIETDCDAAAREQIKAKVAASGIDLSCLATSCVFANPEVRQANIDTALQAIDLAADLGCPCIRVFGGVLPEGLSREDATAGVVEALLAIAPRAAERGVKVCMETHDHWCDPADVANVMKRVNHENIVVNWDIMHPVRVAEVSMDEAFNALKPWICHTHIHDGIWGEDQPLELKPIGEGQVDHYRALELLIGCGYDGSISGEWINWKDFPYEQHLPHELATLKKYEQEITGKG